MELRQNVRRVSASRLFLVVAVVCALAIGLAGIYVMGMSRTPVGAGTSSSFPYFVDRPGPDSPSRNRPPSPDPWAGHGH